MVLIKIKGMQEGEFHYVNEDSISAITPNFDRQWSDPKDAIVSTDIRLLDGSIITVPGTPESLAQSMAESLDISIAVI